jgi:hypothetical protein
MMLFDSKMPTVPSGLNAAGTVPNGCASRKAGVFRNFTPLKPVRPICSPACSDSSAAESGRASKSQSQDWSSLGGAPRTSISTPHRRAAIVAFQIRGFGRYEKIRSFVMTSSRNGKPDPLRRQEPGAAKSSFRPLRRAGWRFGLREVGEVGEELDPDQGLGFGAVMVVKGFLLMAQRRRHASTAWWFR